MCTNPIQLDELTIVACRKCNDCINGRKNDWVARAMAESNTSKYMTAITLTYANDTQENQDGAKVFRYQDVSAFLKRIRRQIYFRHEVAGAVRFLVAGELGSKFKRVHWHMIMFSEHDPREFGEFILHANKQSIAPDHTVPYNKRLLWSLWPHGLVELQKSDQGGISYLLKYIIKDQFTRQKSRGTMREHKVERHAASCFRMSKQPPIGYEYLHQFIANHRDNGTCPVSLDVKVDNYTGFWHPKGDTRKLLIDALRAINLQRTEDTGRPCPQWNALVQSVVSQEKDLERLLYGEQEQEPDSEDDLRGRLRVSQRERSFKTYSHVRQNCGGLHPCQKCQNGFSDHQFDEAKAYALEKIKDHPDKSYEAADQAHRARCNPFCVFKNTRRVIEAFDPYALDD